MCIWRWVKHFFFHGRKRKKWKLRCEQNKRERENIQDVGGAFAYATHTRTFTHIYMNICVHVYLHIQTVIDVSINVKWCTFVYTNDCKWLTILYDEHFITNWKFSYLFSLSLNFMLLIKLLKRSKLLMNARKKSTLRDKREKVWKILFDRNIKHTRLIRIVRKIW